MHPILYRVPLWGGRHFDIASYGVMMALGTIAAVIVAWRLARRDGLAAEHAIDAGFWAVLGGIFGAKIWYVIQYWPYYQNKWDLVTGCRSGLVWYGGVIGGTALIFAYVKVKRLPLLKVLDVCSTASALGLVFGRIGCFLNGCCYGARTDGPLGACFAKVTEGEQIIGSPAFLDQYARGLVDASSASALPVYPTQLFEAASVLVIFAVLLLLRGRRKFYGEQTALLFLFYGVARFAIEFLRGDHERSFAGLTAAQVFSLAIFSAAVAGLVILRTKRPQSQSVAEDRALGATEGPPRGSKS